MSRTWASLFALLLATSSGCKLYFTGADDDDCNWGGGPRPGDSIELRNPETGQCDYFGTWTECDDPCQPCLPTGESDKVAMPSWASCDSSCEGLDETTCMVTSGCRAAYIDGCEGGGTGCYDNRTFYGCWGVDQSGPIQGGGCEGLGAWECSRHDDCRAEHQRIDCYALRIAEDEAVQCDSLGSFQACLEEPILCNDFNSSICPEGTTCNASEICLPYPNCDQDTETPAEDAAEPAYVDCDGICAGFCVPADPVDPGNCYEEALCDMVEPNCPEGSLPGVKDGCYTGYCVPLDECPDDPPPPPDCSQLADEATCIARQDCTAYYEGVDCECNPECQCASWEFADCR